MAYNPKPIINRQVAAPVTPAGADGPDESHWRLVTWRYEMLPSAVASSVYDIMVEDAPGAGTFTSIFTLREGYPGPSASHKRTVTFALDPGIRWYAAASGVGTTPGTMDTYDFPI